MMQMVSANKLSDYDINYNNPIKEWDKVKLLPAINLKTKEKLNVKLFDRGFEFPNFDSLISIYQLLVKDSHLNIVKIHDVIQQGQQVFVILEDCESDLEKLFSKKKSTSWFTTDEIYDLLGQIVRGYQHLRKHKIILRDLTPSNILVRIINNKIILKIGDFALSKILKNDFTSTQTGTPFYQAPETRIVNAKYTDQCDIFSLGLILHQMCYNGNKHADLKDQQELNEFHEWIRQKPFQCQINPLIPPELLKLIERMLQYEPSKRVTWDQLYQQPRLQATFLILEDEAGNARYFVDLTRRVGKGMQGTTFLAKNLVNNTELVAKQISHQVISGKREIQIYEKINGSKHLNVIQLYKIMQYENYTYLFLEKCEANLEEYYKYKQKFTYEETLNMIHQIVKGYIYLKHHKIIHRDLKPENILVQCLENPIYKITDFGVGKILEEQTLTQTQAGTPLYSAPEVLEGSIEYDHVCDIYSLGVMLYYFCYGEHYIKATSMNELQYRLQELAKTDFKCPPNPSINQNLINLIEKMIQHEPGKRITWEQLQASPVFNQFKKPLSQQAVEQITAQRFHSNPNQQYQNSNQLHVQDSRNSNPATTVNLNNRVQQIYNAPPAPDIKGYHEYLFTIYQFAIKVDEALDEELKTQPKSFECLGLRLFIQQFCFACFIDINTLFTARSLTINQKKYIFEEVISQAEWKNSIKFDQEVKQLNQKYEETQAKLQLKEINSSPNFDFLQKKIKHCYDSSTKQVHTQTHADVHKVYQDYYNYVEFSLHGEKDNIYSLKLRYFTERMNNLLIECPIEKARQLTKKEILVKIFTKDLYENYLKKNRSSKNN